MSSNIFSLLSDDTHVMNQDIIEDPVKVLYDENGNMDIEAMIPDYKELSDALKKGQCWYDIMHPNGQPNYAKEGKPTGMPTETPIETPKEEEWHITLPKKRKAEYQNNNAKRARYN
jgi:hypothetical protein